MGKDFRKQRGKKIDEVVFPLPDSLQNIPEGYTDFITQVKERITHERIKTVLSANAALIVLYWEIGARILDRQQSEGWGAKVIDRMSYDLKGAFPEMQGFSPRNLKYMRKLAEAWPDIELVQRTVALISWRSNIALLDKLDDQETRLWYAHKTLELGLITELVNIFLTSTRQTGYSIPPRRQCFNVVCKNQIQRTFPQRINNFQNVSNHAD